MTILTTLLALFDAAILPVGGIWSSMLFVIIIGLGIWKIRNYKSWFILSLAFITLASFLYFVSGGVVNETVVNKLSNWSLFFLLMGTLQLARYSRHSHGAKNN